MSHPSKKKGYTFEVECVKLFESFGLGAKRAWGSNGKTIDEADGVDIVVSQQASLRKIKVQCKFIKKLPLWLGMDPNIVHAVAFKENYGKAYALIPLEHYAGLLQVEQRLHDVPALQAPQLPVTLPD